MYIQYKNILQRISTHTHIHTHIHTHTYTHTHTHTHTHTQHRVYFTPLPGHLLIGRPDTL